MADPLVRGFELDRLSRAWLLTQKRPPHWDIFACGINRHGKLRYSLLRIPARLN